MLIWGRPIMVDLVDVLDVLSLEAKDQMAKTLKITRPSGSDIFVACPNLDNHGGEIERTPSCSIHTGEGMVHCFGCNYSDSLPGYIAKILDLPSRVAGFRWLLKRYSTPPKTQRPSIIFNSNRASTRVFIPEELLEYYDYDHPYMFKRGLTPSVIDLFDLGFDQDLKAITIPVRDEKDRILFVKKRPIGRDKFHKYHIDEGVDKKDHLFGINIVKANIANIKRIFMVEGEFDVMSCYVNKEYSVGTQGDILQPNQIKQLIRIAKGLPLVLMFDNDKAGRACMSKSIPMLAPYFPLFIAKYPSQLYKDPNELLLANMFQKLTCIPIK